MAESYDASATEPQGRRSYSGKVTAIIVVTIVVIFVLLNVISGRNVPKPEAPGPAPTVGTSPAT